MKQKVADLESLVAASSAGGDAAVNTLKAEVQRLKDTLAMEEKKKEALVAGFKEKIEE